jgi:hypothetical protein
VAVELVPPASGCELTLTHEMEAVYAPYVEATARAYSEHLDRLETVLSSTSLTRLPS